jgi:hypothetical protein
MCFTVGPSRRALCHNLYPLQVFNTVFGATWYYKRWTRATGGWAVVVLLLGKERERQLTSLGCESVVVDTEVQPRGGGIVMKMHACCCQHLNHQNCQHVCKMPLVHLSSTHLHWAGKQPMAMGWCAQWSAWTHGAAAQQPTASGCMKRGVKIVGFLCFIGSFSSRASYWLCNLVVPYTHCEGVD